MSLATRLTNSWVAFYTPVVSAITVLPVLFAKQAQAITNFTNTFSGDGLRTLFGFAALALAAGFAAEWLLGRFIRRWQRAEVAQDDSTLWTSLSYLFRRFMREILGLVVFLIVLRTASLALLEPAQLVFVAPFILYLIWLPRLTAALGRFVLAPKRADLRLVNVSDRWARYLYRHLIGLMLLSGISMFIVGFNVSTGIPLKETQIGFWLSSSVHVYIAIIAWTAREGLVEIIRGTDPDRTKFDETVARYFPHFAVAMSAVMWAITMVIIGFDQGRILLAAPHYTTMFWLFLLPMFDTLIRGLVRHLLPPMIGEGTIAEAAYRSTKRSYIKIGRVIAGVFVVLMIAGAWNIDLMNLAAAGIGQRFAANLIGFTMTVATGYVIFELVSLYVNRRLAKEQTTTASTTDAVQSEGGEGGGAGGSRLTTVLPLALISAQVAIVVIFGLLAVGSLGIDITPLLAGAGILGLAIGFGAQTLVTDIVSGVFFLIDDAFRVGEYVEVAGTMGTVEKISIRSMQLRHHRGLVHTIPYGGISQLTNYSRDWVIMKLRFTVPFDTDPNKVKKIFKKIGFDMLEDPIHKEGFLEPFKSQGVFEFDDVGMVIRGKFMAKPGAQWTIRKEVYNRVKAGLEAAGIPFARREVRVAIPGLERAEDLSDTDKAKIVATAAAAEAVRQQQAEAEAAAVAAAQKPK